MHRFLLSQKSEFQKSDGSNNYITLKIIVKKVQNHQVLKGRIDILVTFIELLRFLKLLYFL